MFNWVGSHPAWSAATFVAVVVAGFGVLHLGHWFSQGVRSNRASKKMRAYMGQCEAERRNRDADDDVAGFITAPNSSSHRHSGHTARVRQRAAGYRPLSHQRQETPGLNQTPPRCRSATSAAEEPAYC